MKKFKRPLIYILIFGLAILLVYKAFVTHVPELWQALKSGSEADIERFLMDSDRTVGAVYLSLLQIIQVVSIIIPSAPIQLAGGMVYGALRGYLLCHLSYVFANIVIMISVRHFSGMTELLGNSNKDKVQKALSLINKDDPFVTVLLLCMIPLIPNGIIPYAASQMDINAKSFTFAVFLGSIYPVASLAIAGNLILSGDYIVSAAVLLLNVIIVVILYKKKNQVTKFIEDVRDKFVKN